MGTFYPVLLLLTLSLLVARAASARHLLATVVDSDSDILPARVMMLSATLNADLPSSVARIIFVTDRVSKTWARTLVEHDGLTFAVLPSLVLAKSTATLIPLFSLTDYDAVLYLSPHTLVNSSLAALFACRPFCAMFHTPCSFSTGLMTLTPSADVHAALVERAGLLRTDEDRSCRRENTPDWLEEEACILNAHFGKQLLNASVFRAEHEPSEGIRRLPSGTKMAHYFYYPRMTWEIPPKCGKLQTVDYTTPYVLRPWHWWTYAAMDLSWKWREYRLLLKRPHGTPDADWRIFVIHTAIVCGAGFLGMVLLRRWRWGKEKERGKGVRKIREQEMMLHVCAGGLVAWVVSWVVGLGGTPATVAPEYGFALFGMYRAMTMWVLWCVFGGGYVSTRAVAEDSGRLRVRRRRQGMAETGLICVGEAMLVVVAMVGLGWMKTETVTGKFVGLGVGLILYCAVHFAVIVALGYLWLNVGTKGRMEGAT